jgi:microcystin-dependent protein
MTLSYTKFLHFAVPDFLTEPWHAEFAQTMNSIDEIIYRALIAKDIDFWQNSTSYDIGNLVIAPESGQIYSCGVVHTSSPAPMTFSQERILHPTYWTSLSATGTTGDVRMTFKSVADEGWIMANDGSIGNSTSNATTRANADTEALFTLLYNNITSTQGLPCTITPGSPTIVNCQGHIFAPGQKIIFTTSGSLPSGMQANTPYFITTAGFTPNAFEFTTIMFGPPINTTGPQSGNHGVTGTFDLELQRSDGVTQPRGAGAATDFANSYRLIIPKMLGRALACAGSGVGLVPRRLGGHMGADTETQTMAKLAPHTHLFNVPQTGVPRNPITHYEDAFAFNNISFSGPNSFSYTYEQPAGGGQPLNITQPTQYINVMIKL